jgi:hypothetical protein
MKNIAIACLITMSLGTISPASAVENLIESVATGCEKELTSFCSQVTPGDGRVLACLYAHGDKISSSCEFALYDAAAQLERAIGALTYFANECADDLDNHCAAVEIGEARLAQCLLDNEANLQPRCANAIDETDLSVE